VLFFRSHRDGGFNVPIAKACVNMWPASLIKAMLLASTPNRFQYHHGSGDGKREEEFPFLDCAISKSCSEKAFPGI
jgi:hypothetical protein